MTDNVRVLGRFVPSRLQSEIIETEVLAHLPGCCRNGRVGVRTPDPRVVANPGNVAWHQDGHGVQGECRHLIVWATEMPTEVRMPDGSIFAGEPYDLVWLNNDIMWHRQPPGTDEGRRWFLAVRCGGG